MTIVDTIGFCEAVRVAAFDTTVLRRLVFVLLIVLIFVGVDERSFFWNSRGLLGGVLESPLLLCPIDAREEPIGWRRGGNEWLVVLR